METTIDVVVKLVYGNPPATGDSFILWLAAALILAAVAVVVLCTRKGNVKSNGHKTSLFAAIVAAGLAVTMILSSASFAAPSAKDLVVSDLVGYVDASGNVTFVNGKITNKGTTDLTVNGVKVSRPKGIDDGNAVWTITSRFTDFFKGITTVAGTTNKIPETITIAAGESVPLSIAAEGLTAAKALANKGKSIIKIQFTLVEAHNTEAPRAYLPYPEELADNESDISLPNPFYFYDKSADPNGNGVVDSPEEWEARRQELLDILQYYVYGSRLDPLKSDITITKVTATKSLVFADGAAKLSGSRVSASGTKALHPSGAFTSSSTLTMNEGFVYSEDEDFVYSGDMAKFKSWKKGDTWAQHTDICTAKPTGVYTISGIYKDTNPANEGLRTEAAEEGMNFTVSVTVPDSPLVDGVIRDETASRNGAGYPLFCGASGVQATALLQNGYATFSGISGVSYETFYAPVVSAVPFTGDLYQNPWLLDSGTLMHTGWGVSRSLDVFEVYNALSAEEKTELGDVLPLLDTNSVGTMGCSQGAKASIIGAIFDNGGENGESRIDVCVQSDPGGGGTAGFRYFNEGQLYNYEAPYAAGFWTTPGRFHWNGTGINESTQRAIQNASEGQWFGDRAQIFTSHPEYADKTFFDLHELIAAYCTTTRERVFFVDTAEAQDAWIASPTTVLDIMAATEVWEFCGQGDNIAVNVRDGAHANQARNMATYIAIMDHVFYGTKTITRKQLTTLQAKADSTDHAASDGSGTILPTKTFPTIASMGGYPYYIPSKYLTWSRPTKHYLYTYEGSVTAGIPMSFTFYSDAKKVTLTLPNKKQLSANVVDGKAVISLTAEQAMAGCYTATATGSKDQKSIEICGFSLKDALRTAIADNSALQHDAGAQLCFTTPLQNYNDKEDPVVVSMVRESGKEVVLPGDEYDYDNKVYLSTGYIVHQDSIYQPYGVSICLYTGTYASENVEYGEHIIFKLRNAKIEALQGFEVAYNAELEMYNPGGKDGQDQSDRQRFKPVYNYGTDAQIPTWYPENRQNTPISGLPLDETRWPRLGTWASDYNADGTFKDLDAIRPLHSEATENFGITMEVGKVTNKSVKIIFKDAEETAVALGTKDFAVAANVSGLDFTLAADLKSATLTFDQVENNTEITIFIFRAVDGDLDMMDGPITLKATYSVEP